MPTGKVSGYFPGRCKDCPSTDLVGARCQECRDAHNAREAARRKTRRKAGQCIVCGAPVARSKQVIVEGELRRVNEPATCCKTHLAYFAARAAESRTS